MDINNEMTIGSVNKNVPKQPKDNSVLDQDDFLKILAATISNPPFPGGGGDGGGSDMDFMSQMIQMNMLDQMSALTESIQSTMVMTHQQQALSLVGKQVIISGPDNTKIEGIVEKVKFTPDGLAVIQVDGKVYSMQSVLEVGEAGAIIEDPNQDTESEDDTGGKGD